MPILPLGNAPPRDVPIPDVLEPETLLAAMNAFRTRYFRGAAIPFALVHTPSRSEWANLVRRGRAWTTGYVLQAAVLGQKSVVRLINPANSHMALLVHRVRVYSAGVSIEARFSLDLQAPMALDTVGSVGNAALNLRGDIIGAPGVATWDQGAYLPDQPNNIDSVLVGANQDDETKGDPFLCEVLSNGNFQVWCPTVNTKIAVVIDWAEVPDPSYL